MGTTTANTKAPIPPIDYTSRDFESIVQDMVRAIPFMTPEWTDHNLSDEGIVLQRLTAMVCDVLHFYLDRMANEAFLPTAITRRSVINLLKLIGFELSSATPSSVDVVFTLQAALPGDLLIPKGTPLQTTADATEQPVLFETAADLVIPAGSLTGTVSAIQGQTQSESVGVSSGLPRQRFTLIGTPIIDGTLQIFVDEGAGALLWVDVETFVNSGADDKNYTSQKDENNITTIFFGDNSQGKIPNAGSLITATYRVGGGTNGNVGADTITTINAAFTYGGSPVTLAVTNPAEASGGEDEMSIDEAKTLGPLSLQALDRAVTLQDFVTLSETFPGVAKASAEMGGLMGLVGEGCCCGVTIYIAPRGGGPPSSLLKASLLAYLEARKMVGTCIQIGDPEYAEVQVKGKVYVASNFAVDSAAVTMSDSIDQYFDLGSDFVQFGTPLYLSDFYHMMDAVQGIDHVDLTEVTKTPSPKKTGMANCSFSDFVIGTDSKEETWTVIFITSSTFSVRGSLSGIQTNIGTTGTPYLSDTGAVGFTITCTSPPMPGDQATFETSQKIANVPMKTSQIMKKGSVVLQFVGGAKVQKECP